MLEAARQIFRGAGIEPEFRVTEDRDAGVEVHRFRNGGATIIGLLSNPQLRVNELGPPEFKSNQRFERPRTIRLVLPHEFEAYDVRKGQALGRRKELAATLEPYEPAIYALLPTAASALHVSAPARVPRGGNAQVGVRISTAAGTHVFHMDVVDPAGAVVPHYSGNLLAPQGRAGKLVPIAYNDPPGRWQVRVKDVLTGSMQTAVMEVY